jgi:GxxExxY protein
MNADYVHSDITGEVIGAAYAVYNALGHGFLEKVYENALVVELGKRGVRVQTQTPIEIR